MIIAEDRKKNLFSFENTFESILRVPGKKFLKHQKLEHENSFTHCGRGINILFERIKIFRTVQTQTMQAFLQ